jgi:putative transposase
LANGRKFRTANLKDDCTRECPAILVDFSLPGRRVASMLEDVARERGYPDMLVVDNGPELRGVASPDVVEIHRACEVVIGPAG